jgi:hypothetical protein
MPTVQVHCTKGHMFTLVEEQFEPEIIAGISWCPVREGQGPDCGALVKWVRVPGKPGPDLSGPIDNVGPSA